LVSRVGCWVQLQPDLQYLRRTRGFVQKQSV